MIAGASERAAKGGAQESGGREARTESTDNLPLYHPGDIVLWNTAASLTLDNGAKLLRVKCSRNLAAPRSP
jgi:hypothetical protein